MLELSNKISKESSSYKMLNDLEFCVFDLETTGGNHQYDQIIEIGLIKVSQLKIVDEKSYLVKPNIPIPEFIQKLTSINPNDLIEKPIIEDIIDEILKFMGDSILVAHNSSFDIPFFNSVLKRLGRNTLKNRALCTNLMTKNLIPGIMNSNLAYMSKLFNIPHKKAHRALEDARATAYLLLEFLGFFLEKKIKKINHLYYPRKKYEFDTQHIKKEDYSQNAVENVLKIKTPIVVTLKGGLGQINSVIPLSNPSVDFENIKALIQNQEWNVATFKMVGSFVHAFLILNGHFSKLSPENQEKILQHIKTLHNIEDQCLSPSDANIFKDHFIVTPHLIPEQFSVFPLFNLNPKKQLIFRYPGHQKKVFQFLSHHSKKLNAKKLKKVCIHPLLKNLFINYLNSNKGNAYYLFSKANYKHNFAQFKKDFEHHLSKNQINYNYPKEHI